MIRMKVLYILSNNILTRSF